MDLTCWLLQVVSILYYSRSLYPSMSVFSPVGIWGEPLAEELTTQEIIILCPDCLTHKVIWDGGEIDSTEYRWKSCLPWVLYTIVVDFHKLSYVLCIDTRIIWFHSPRPLILCFTITFIYQQQQQFWEGIPINLITGGVVAGWTGIR